MTRRKVVGTTTITAGVVCRSLELMTALGMMEDHNRLLPATESRSGQGDVALRNRGVLVLTCVLVALGSLLCVGKESLAKQPGKAPSPGSPATSHRPAGAPKADHQTPAAQPQTPAAQPKPTPRKPVDRGPTSQPTKQRPAKQRPTERPAPGPRHRAEPPRRQFAPHERSALKPKPVHEKPVPEPRPVHEKPVHEPPGLQESGQEPSPHKPVGPDHIRHHPQPEKTDKDTSSRPVHEQPAPQTTPHYPHGKGSTGQQEGTGTPDLHGKPTVLPDKETVHPEKKSSIGPPEQIRQSPEHGVAARLKPHEMAGNGAYKRANPEERRPVYVHPTQASTSAEAADSRPASMGSMGGQGTADHRPSLSTVAGHETGSATTLGAQPSYRQAEAEDGIAGSRSVDLRGEEPTGLAGSSSAPLPEHQAVRSSQAVDPVPGRDALPAAPSGGKQRPVREQAQLASGTSFGSTKLLLDPLWDERGSVVDLTPETLRSVQDTPSNPSTGTLYRGSLTQRGPPPEIPSLFFGFISMMVGAASGSGSSGSGVAPLLLAVIAPCLIIVLYRGRSRIFQTFLRPATIPRPALERPG